MVVNVIIKGIEGNRFAPKNTTAVQEAEGYANATREQALAIACYDDGGELGGEVGYTVPEIV